MSIPKLQYLVILYHINQYIVYNIYTRAHALLYI
nr:MAG TPA: hypothetical protein [Caudoviricetes sp.]